MVTIIANLGSALARSTRILRGNNVAVAARPAQAIGQPRSRFGAALLKALSAFVA